MNNYLEQNQTGIIKGIKVQCLPTSDGDAEKWENTEGGVCEFYGCAFYGSLVCNSGDALCASYERYDNKDVYFKKVE